MNPFRVIQVLILASFAVSGTEALANRQVPSVGTSASEQTSLYGYTYGESCLFGGAASYSATTLWTGKKAQAQQHGESNDVMPTFATALVPNNVKQR